ncbi:MAG: hypothetical protein JXX28_15270 [Deltaproteobacteria bacterium]|nr:hypothetical protein [Deltaproteobacteria bacterium]
MGINEAITLPGKIAAQLEPERRAQEIAQKIGWVRDLGVTHVRVHSAVYPWSSWRGAPIGGYDELDRVILPALTAGITPLVMIGPWPGNRTAAFAEVYPPPDWEAYLAWVQATVERYDGDGVGDAPGLVGKVRTWEVDNEPDLHNFAPPRGGRGLGAAPADFCRPDEYAEVLVRTAAAVRAADPAAEVIHGGLARLAHPQGQAYARSLWSTPGFAVATDGVNLHGYPQRSVAELWQVVDLAMALAPDEQVWITETSTLSVRVGDERSQAHDLLLIVLEALHAGVHRVYWHSLHENPTVFDGGSAPVSRGRSLMTGSRDAVVQDRGIRRFSAMRRKLAGDTLAAFLQRYGALSRGGLTRPECSNCHALRLGEDVLVWGEEGASIRVHAEGVPQAVVPGDMPPTVTADEGWSGLRLTAPVIRLAASPSY